MALKSLNIILSNYTIEGTTPSQEDEFEILLNGVPQQIDSINLIPDSGVAAISIIDTNDYGTLEIRCQPGGNGTFFPGLIPDSDNVWYSNSIPDVSDSYFMTDLYGDGVDTINPHFEYQEISGCIDSTAGPHPDKYGFCVPDGSTPRLPNEFGYCKTGQLGGDYGYNVCNFDPYANISNDTCVTNANGVVGTEDVPFNAFQDDTYCDCFGHTLDCDSQCLSAHPVGVCSEEYRINNYVDPIYGIADDGNSTGCKIEACNNNCIDADEWMGYFIDNNYGAGNGYCDDSELYFCEGVAQGIGHPLVGTPFMDSTGFTTFNCEFNECLDCAGGCSTTDFLSTTEGKICGECIGGTRNATVGESCKPPWIDIELANYICLDGWSQDCNGNCPSGSYPDLDYTITSSYAGPCYDPTLLTQDSATGLYLDLIAVYPAGICGIDCSGDCGGSLVLDTCSVCGGEGCIDGDGNTVECGNDVGDYCGCDGEVRDCNGDCGGTAELDDCNVCGGEKEFTCANGVTECIPGDGTCDDECSWEGQCDCDGNIRDCTGACGDDATAVIDDCGNCCLYDTITIWDDGDTANACKFYTTDVWATWDDIENLNCTELSSADCIIRPYNHCSCAEEVYDCTATDICPSLAFADEAQCYIDSCGGGVTVDSCGTCGGPCGSCDCGCNEVNVDECGDCNGGVSGLSDCSGGIDDFGKLCTDTPGSCTDPVSTCDMCGVCGGSGYGTTSFNEVLDPAGNIIPGLGAQTLDNCDCDGTPPVLWCYDGDGNGVGCYDCPTLPQYRCENPGGAENSHLYIQVITDVATDCPQTNADEVCDTSYDQCGNCGGDRNSVICSGGSNDSITDNYCCGGENYCDCNDSCWYDAPSTNEGYNAFGGVDDSGYYDCAGNCHGSAYIDTCGNCCFEGEVYTTDEMSVPTTDGTLCGYVEGTCGCNGEVFGCDGICGSGLVNDYCGNCGGSCTAYDASDAGWTPCVVDDTTIFIGQNSCGTCNTDWEPVVCDTSIPANTFNQVCNCDGIQVCDDCGICGGSNKKPYYYDEDGDGVVCGDIEPTWLCDGSTTLSEICGVGGLCYHLVDGYSGGIEYGNDCDCPFTYDQCGRCVEVDGNGALTFENQEICQVDVNGARLPNCPTEQDAGLGTTCNSRYCAYDTYECLQSCESNPTFYIKEYIPGPNVVDFIEPAQQPFNVGEWPQEDACGNCLKPGCSNWDDPGVPYIIGQSQPSLLDDQMTGSNSICNANLNDGSVVWVNPNDGTTPLPTNTNWNAQCVDCNGFVNGDDVRDCLGGCQSAIVAWGGTDCTDVFSCESPIFQYPGHPHANVDTDSDGINDSINYNCDNGACLDCAGLCTCTESAGCGNELQYNLDGHICGCGPDGTLTNGNGCCNTGVAYASQADYDGGLNPLTDYGAPDCSNSCESQLALDCSGECGGDAIESQCCNTITYCFVGPSGTGTFDYGNGQGEIGLKTDCTDIVACGCYSDSTACNYNLTQQGDVNAFLLNKLTYEVNDYECKFANYNGYFTIGEDGFVTDEFIELCGGNFGYNPRDCCDCDLNVIDCLGECAGQELPKPYWSDPDCDGIGSGDPTDDLCLSELPATSGCWSSNIDSQTSPDLLPYCKTDLLFDVSITSQEVDGRIIPLEEEACWPTEAAGGKYNQDGPNWDLCTSIQSRTECESGTNPCKWEPDWFFGVDDCGNCWRTNLDTTNNSFNQNGDTSKDCNGCCFNGSGNDTCGSPFNPGNCNDGSTTCEYNSQNYGNGVGVDQCGDCLGNGQRCAGCIFQGADNYPDDSCVEADGYTPMICTHNCEALNDWAANSSTTCCEFSEDCQGFTAETADYDWVTLGPSVRDHCGVCTGGSTGSTFNEAIACGCCPPEEESYWDNVNKPSNISDIYGKCPVVDAYNAVQDYLTIEEWIATDCGGLCNSNDFSLNPTYSEGYKDCNSNCFGDDYVDDCTICNDPDDAWVITISSPGSNYTGGDSNNYLIQNCVNTNGDLTITYWDDCGVGGNDFNYYCLTLPGENNIDCSNNQCVCGSVFDECSNCNGDGFQYGGPSGDCINTNNCNNMDCEGTCNGSATWDTVLSECCTGTLGSGDERDWCGRCHGDNICITPNADGVTCDFVQGPDAGCDGVCFSGLVNLGCGCDDGDTILHCLDAEGDGLGDAYFPRQLCPIGTDEAGLDPSTGVVFNLPTSYGATGEVNTYVNNCSDGDPSCDSPNVLDQCGECGGSNIVCYGCNDSTACNYGMRRDGLAACNDNDSALPCAYTDNDVCVYPRDCEVCNQANNKYCPDTNSYVANSVSYTANICIAGWTNGGECYGNGVWPMPSGACVNEVGCDTNGCESYLESYCPYDSKEEVCYYPDDCSKTGAPNCVLGFQNTNTGSWNCANCTSPDSCDNCACAGCILDECTLSHDENAIWPQGLTADENPFCHIYNGPPDCTGLCDGTCSYDDCGNCSGTQITGEECPGGPYVDLTEVDAFQYECGCENIILYTNPSDWTNTPSFCDDGQEPASGCSTLDEDGNVVQGLQWLGCETCGVAPDVCAPQGPYGAGCCPPDYCGTYTYNGACSVCTIPDSCDFVPEADRPQNWQPNDNLCRYTNVNGACVCELPWNGSWEDHNEYCVAGGVYIDSCDPEDGEDYNVYNSIDDPNFNICTGCMTAGALNYNDQITDPSNAGACFFGDLVMLPSSTIGSSNDYYIIRPAGNDTGDNQCPDDINNYGNCNENYGGFQVVDTDGTDNQVVAYKLILKNSFNVVERTWWAVSEADSFDPTNALGSQNTGNVSGDNPECPIISDGGSYNLHTFVSCGVGYQFITDDTYTFELTIYDIAGNSHTYSKELSVFGSVGWFPSIGNAYSPYQGYDLDLGAMDFRYTKEDYNSGPDQRPPLGCFAFSDEPNSSGININTNIDDDGKYITYFSEYRSLTGKKWGGENGIGSNFKSLLPNIEKECGVDLSVTTNIDNLWEEPEAGTGYGSNNVCLTGALYDSSMWYPDVAAYTQRSLTGARSKLWMYYDRDEQPQQYEETSGPTEAIFLFQPVLGSEFTNRTMKSVTDRNPMYLVDLDWGDGQKEYESSLYSINESGKELRHTYEKPGVYEITGYWVSMFRGRTCVYEQGDMAGQHDGRELLCESNANCYGYCSDTIYDNFGQAVGDWQGKCIGGNNHGGDCDDHNTCHEYNHISGKQDLAVICQPKNTPAHQLHNFGVDRFFKFTIRININEKEDYSNHPYIINESEYTQPIIGGMSEKSIYYKNLKRQLGYMPDLPSDSPLDLNFQFHYDKIMSQYALLHIDENLMGSDIAAFMVPVYDRTNDDELIFNGKYLESHGELGKHVGNIDIGQIRTFGGRGYSNQNVSMAEMLGFDDSVAGNPSNPRYWKNIIPKDYFTGNRTGLIYNNNPSYTTPEYGDDLTGVNESDEQIWRGTNKYGNPYYYPVLPKKNIWGLDEYERLGLQGSYQFDDGLDRIPFGTFDRMWDAVDDVSLVTSTNSNEFNRYLLIDIDFSSVDDGKLQDLSGNGNDGFILNDYRVDYEEETRVPEKVETQVKPELDKDGKQF